MKRHPVSPLFAFLALFCCAGQAHCGFFPDDAFSDSARGTTAAQFLKVPPSARFAALAGAGLALNGPDTFFLNPAGLASVGRKETAFSASYETLLEQSSRTGLVFSKGFAAGIFSAGCCTITAGPASNGWTGRAALPGRSLPPMTPLSAPGGPALSGWRTWLSISNT